MGMGGSVCFWSLAYLANSILLDQRLQESCAVGMTTLEPVVLGFCWASVWGASSCMPHSLGFRICP